MRPPVPVPREFNNLLVESIDESLAVLLSQQVVDALYLYLQTSHSISKDEIPYRLETLLSTLERTFGNPSGKTISRAIARKFYTKLGITFPDSRPYRSLVEYVEEAKIKLQEDGDLP